MGSIFGRIGLVSKTIAITMIIVAALGTSLVVFADTLQPKVVGIHGTQAQSGNSQPQITTIPVTTAFVGQLYTYDVDGTDADGDTLLYFFTTSPSGMTMDYQTGLITWTPTSSQIGDHLVDLFVGDNQQQANSRATQTFTVTVSDPPPPPSSVDWADVTNKPAGFADDVDNQLSETEVDGFVTNGPLDFDGASTLGGQSISTGPHTTSLDWGALTGVPADIADGDDDTNTDTLASLSCSTDQQIKWNGSTWECFSPHQGNSPNIVNLYANSVSDDLNPICSTVGNGGFEYTVPTGEVLLITDIISNANGAGLWTDARGVIFRAPNYSTGAWVNLGTPLRVEQNEKLCFFTGGSGTISMFISGTQEPIVP